MLGGQALLRFVELRGLAVGVLKASSALMASFLSTSAVGIVQRLDPVARKDRGVLLRAALGGGDHGAARLLQRRNRAAAGAGGVDDQLALGGHAVAQRGQVRGGNIRARKIEFVLDAVEGAVADQNQHEIVFRLGFAGDRGQRFA